jgi:hypothetical protein
MPSVGPANVRAVLSTLVSARLAIETYALAVAAKLTADTLSRVAPVVFRRLLGQCGRIYKRHTVGVALDLLPRIFIGARERQIRLVPRGRRNIGGRRT